MNQEDIAIIEQASMLYETGRFELALETLQSLEYQPPKIGEEVYWTIMVNSLVELKQFERAQSFITSSLEQDPDKGHLHYLLGIVFINLDNKKKALQCILQAVDLNPEMDLYHTLAGGLYIELGKYSDAYSHIDSALEINPENHEAIYFDAILLIQERDYINARDVIEDGLALHPESTLLQGLFTELDGNNRPDISFIKEQSLAALANDPHNRSAKDSLLFSLKNNNNLVRFFVSRGFNRYTIEWTFRRVIAMIIFWKGTLLWAGFALLYLLITWAGTALFYTIIRNHAQYKLLLTPQYIRMSNTFLVILSIGMAVILLNLNGRTELLFAITAGLLFILLTAISYHEIHSKEGKVAFMIFFIIALLILSLAIPSLIAFGIISILLLLFYAFLFTLNIAFK